MQCVCAVLLSVACFALQYFPTLCHKRHDFRNNVLEHKMCVLIFPTILYEKFLILTRIKPQIITNAHSCSRKVPVIIGQILVKLEFSGQIFEKSTEKSNLMNIRPIGRPAVQCGRTDGRTDTTKLIVFFFAIF